MGRDALHSEPGQATDQQVKDWYASVGGTTAAFVKAAAQLGATADQIASAWTILSGSPTTARDVAAAIGKGQFAGYGWDSKGGLISKRISARQNSAAVLGLQASNSGE